MTCIAVAERIGAGERVALLIGQDPWTELYPPPGAAHAVQIDIDGRSSCASSTTRTPPGWARLAEVAWEQRETGGDSVFPGSQSLRAFRYAGYADLVGLTGSRVGDPEQLQPHKRQPRHRRNEIRL